jgi:hypothetical protein
MDAELKCLDPFAHKGRECLFQIDSIARAHDRQAHAKGIRRTLQVFRLRGRHRWISGIDQRCNRLDCGNNVVQQFEALWCYLGVQVGKTGELAARTVEACD